MSKNQKIFFYTISALFILAAVSSVSIIFTKSTGQNSTLPKIFFAGDISGAAIEDSSGPAVLPNKEKDQSSAEIAREAQHETTVAPLPTQTQKTISIKLNAGDFSTMLTPEAGANLYDALSQARDAGKINFFGRQYSALGFYVTGIGSLRESAGNHLLYYINGKSATVGISSYVLKDGDIIDWKLE